MSTGDKTDVLVSTDRLSMLQASFGIDTAFMGMPAAGHIVPMGQCPMGHDLPSLWVTVTHDFRES